jgi:hypothetical protein
MKEGGIDITEAYDSQIVGSRKAENIPLTWIFRSVCEDLPGPPGTGGAS